MIRICQLKLETCHTQEQLWAKAAQFLHVDPGDIRRLEIRRRSIDARKKPEITYSYTLDLQVKDQDRILRRFRGRENQVCRWEEATYVFPQPGNQERKHPVVIVGMGPAGLFCGYFLALHGYRPLLLERGRDVEHRQKDVEAFWESGVLDAVSNVQFGEGGAGTFSDGKLNTLVKDRGGRNRAVLETLVRFGAPERILYEAKPHIGTDVLCQVVKGMRKEILRLGGEVRFESQVTGLSIRDGQVEGVLIGGVERLACRQVVLAIGHSARDTFQELYEEGIPMEAKAFAVGLRAEHSQSMINASQYGREEAGVLGAACYKVVAKSQDGRGVYSFCMCPGGYVVNASSEPGHLAINGMSYSARDGANANSAVVVTVTPRDFGEDHPLAGIAFQRQLEERACQLAGGKIPVQRYGDFCKCVKDGATIGTGGVGEEKTPGPDLCDMPDGSWKDTQAGRPGQQLLPQCKGAYAWADVSTILPRACNQAIVEGMKHFGRQIKGFDGPDVILSGVESRTSSPVRICRDESLQSTVRGLYPCGEGAGYAGGITSAAMDGMRVAEAIAAQYAPG